jgi:hypothetical protein
VGYYKRFGEFCRVAAARLGKGFAPESEPKLHRAFRRYEEGLPWEYVLKGSVAEAERETVTCPSCEREAVVKSGGWHCFYCGGGTGGYIDTEHYDDPDDEHAPEVRSRLKAIDREETLEFAIKLFNEAGKLRGSIGEVYLRARGLDLPPDDEAMRWHDRCPFGGQRQPCIVSLLRDALTDEVTGLHRTYVYSADSGMAERKVLGRLKASAVKIWKFGDSKSLAVGEGIETVLSAVKLGIAEPPAWAATVAGNLGTLPVIPGVKRLLILADNDASGAGERSARRLRVTWENELREAEIRMAPVVGEDFNDALRGRQR